MDKVSESDFFSEKFCTPVKNLWTKHKVHIPYELLFPHNRQSETVRHSTCRVTQSVQSPVFVRSQSDLVLIPRRRDRTRHHETGRDRVY